MAKKDVIQRLDEMIEDRSLLKHPYYQAWQRGQLTIPMLGQYAAQYFHNEAAFPTYLSSIHARCDSLSVRQRILDNLWDEEYGDNNHPELWLRFCESLGLSRTEVRTTQLLPETQYLINTYRAITGSSSLAESLAAIYVYERQVPDIAREKAAGLKAFYGIDDARSLHFFTIHMALDPQHASTEADIIREHTEDEAAVESSAQRALEAQWGFLDGAYRVAGLADH